MSQVRSGNHKFGFHGRENARCPLAPWERSNGTLPRGRGPIVVATRVPETSLTASLRKKIKLIKEMRISNQNEASLGGPWGDLTIGEQA